MSVPRHTHSGAHRASRLAALRPRVLRRTVRRVVARPASGIATIPPAFMLLAAAAFVGGAVTSVTTHQITIEHARDVAAAEAAQEQANRERADAASAERLSAQATAYLMARRDAARSLAAGAVVSAGQVTTASAGVLDPTETAELDGAVARLAELLGQAPGSTVALDAALSTVAAAPEPTTTPDMPPQPAPVAPLADVTALVEASRTAEPADASTTGGVLRSAQTARSGEAATLAGDVARDAATRAPLTAAAVAGAVPVDSAAPAAAAPAAAPASVAPVTSAAHELLATGTTQPVTPTVPAGTNPVAALAATDAPPTALLATADLGLSATTDLAAAAQRVLDLSAQVQATVDQRIAEREAAARAAAEAAEAERRRLARETTSQRIKRLVAGATAAPPGQIPAEFLCDVPFDHALRLRCDAAAALTLMDQAYRAETGKHLVIVSSYRTTDVQTQLFLEKGNIAAAPGTSNHERGQAIDVGGAGSLGQFDAPLYLWLKANAERFGWHHPAIMEPGGAGPLEPWHWEYGTKD